MAWDEHSAFRENLSAYALGALETEEIRALEAHLLTCDSCRAELAEYRAVSDGLLAALPPRPPSAALRKRLQAQLPSAQKKTQPRVRFAWSFGKFALGGALALLLLMNLFSFLQMRQIQKQQETLAQQVRTSQFALSMLAYPSTQAIPIAADNLTGSVLLDRERNTAALVMWHLPELTQDQTYQAWLIQPDGQRVSAGTFRPQKDDSYTTKPVYPKQDLSNFVGIGVTVEPAGGSDQPTGQRIFKVDF
jgi:anti-sigma-K factor RskA